MTTTLLHLSLLFASAYTFNPLVASVARPKSNDVPQQHVEQIVREKLERIASGFDGLIDSTMRTLDMETELSEKTEQCLLQSTGVDERRMVLSEKTRAKRERVRDCLSSNSMVVHRLLMGWETKDQTKNTQLFQRIDFTPTNKEEDCPLMGNGGVTDVQMKETEGYDTAQQVITHTARDWTSASASCRDATNGWIIDSVVKHCTGIDELRVLVPGSGLCRLAYDIATCEHLLKAGTDIRVEANDSSVTMAFAAKSVLELVHKQAVAKIFPFVSDPQRNEIYAAKRFEMEVFPDEHALAAYRNFYSIKKACPDLTYTVGDFSSTYSHESKSGMYNVVATSFFIDTATNIYEYIFIMKHLLQKDKSSVWVNCGPVQWHPCAMLRPTVDELEDILQTCGFQLITWEIANEAVAYRHPDDFAPLDARYTREEGYRPLRFVARLSDFNSADDLQERIEYIDYLNEVANGKVKE